MPGVDRSAPTRDELDQSGSIYMRIVDIGGMTAFFILQFYLAKEVAAGVALQPEHAWWILGGGVLGGYLWADFVSGFVHFIADNFGSVRTPFLGPVFFRTFREHHVDPLAITRHDFFEVNGANCVVSLPFAAATLAFVPIETSLLGLAFATFMLLFLFGIFLTNQFHRWAHLPAAPSWIRRLQATGLILGAAHHERHHRAPYDTYYCITSGLMNPLLARIRFFELIKAPLGRMLEPIVGKAEEVVGVPAPVSPSVGAPRP